MCMAVGAGTAVLPLRPRHQPCDRHAGPAAPPTPLPPARAPRSALRGPSANSPAWDAVSTDPANCPLFASSFSSLETKTKVM